MNRWQEGLRTTLGVLLWPTKTFERIARDPRPGAALGTGLLLGAIWAGFMSWLAAEGHRPSMTRGLPMPADQYYAVAAVYLTPLMVALTALTAGIAHGLARALGGQGSWPSTLSTVGLAYAVPLLTLYLIPDVVVYAVAGHGALALVVRFGLPLAVAVVTLRVVQALRVAHGLGRGRALAAALVAGVVQAVPFALLVR